MTDPDSSTPARLDAVVLGRVQGVGYRFFVLREGGRLGLAGWVANRPDGGVECRAEGPRAALEELLASLRLGPPGALVERVDEVWSHATGGLPGFTVRSFGHSGD